LTQTVSAATNPTATWCRSSSSQEEVWIETNIRKRECVRFAPASLTTGAQQQQAAAAVPLSAPWQPQAAERPVQPGDRRLTLLASPTDAYGVIEFASGPHPTLWPGTIRVAEDTDPALLLHVLTNVWRPAAAKAGAQAFTVACKILSCRAQAEAAALSGLLKAAKTHRSLAYQAPASTTARVSRLVARGHRGGGAGQGESGVCHRHRSLGSDPGPRPAARPSRTCKYFAISSAGKSLSRAETGTTATSYWLTTAGAALTAPSRSCGAIWRRYLCSLRLVQVRTLGVGLDRVPVVATLLEGGASVSRLLLDLTSGSPPVPR
uniref:START domain-containing protein n=1 Tax=Macrostomum lignano TaxID=282301 RepID=A0A1I8F517_9PLAT